MVTPGRHALLQPWSDIFDSRRCVSSWRPRQTLHPAPKDIRGPRCVGERAWQCGCWGGSCRGCGATWHQRDGLLFALMSLTPRRTHLVLGLRSSATTTRTDVLRDRFNQLPAHVQLTCCFLGFCRRVINTDPRLHGLPHHHTSTKHVQAPAGARDADLVRASSPADGRAALNRQLMVSLQ